MFENFIITKVYWVHFETISFVFLLSILSNEFHLKILFQWRHFIIVPLVKKTNSDVKCYLLRKN